MAQQTEKEDIINEKTTGIGNYTGSFHDGSYGRRAAYIAADTVSHFERRKSRKAREEDRTYMNRLYLEMNRGVCEYAQRHHIRSMGATAACLRFSDEGICCANVGDSRIYQVNQTGMTQISTDQVLKTVFGSKGPLLQYIGMNEEELTLRPEIFTVPYRSGDCYLLCSDGVSDMVSDEEISKIIQGEEDPACAIQLLMEAVTDAGAKDNATAVLCMVD